MDDEKDVLRAWEAFIERGAVPQTVRAEIAASWVRSRQHQVTIDRAHAPLLTGIHPGFRESNSIVFHRYGTDPAYHGWRGSVLGSHGSVSIQSSERNPPPLFGAGQIDAIPDGAIEAAARRKFPGSAQVNGRVSRLKDGRVGRFGWKAQTATLAEFVRSAAAGEIGLEIPGRHQAADPRMPGLAATGLDMDESECDAMVEYVRSLAVPVAIKPADQKRSAQVKLLDVEKRIAELDKVRAGLSSLIAACPGHGRAADCPILQALGGEEE